ncbi:S-adenosyl-L-methionine-dependent methyltransferase [Crepidotus variabilis]|uniref:S-adenosyl-L-methionine-dependent methyltransferase n=1 Tax=Crepidotus variabilis TaxID=179855 RepID=A0A9P6BCP4_9AGAR|nr:S-adenosyl-L-methionine-dependent methyltransferase [Crepidotus variabilis]
MPPIRRVKLNRNPGLSATWIAPKPEFAPKEHWISVHDMILHPYCQEVPYMQAYNPLLLKNYGDRPPARVLDLGCGPGHWLLFAADIWINSTLTGFDLMNLISSPPSNVRFVQGDFINFRLPFADATFDFVRMANLVLCIPHDKWEFILGEVRRVLTIGGRMELIDDQISFPYGKTPSPPRSGESSPLDSDMTCFEDEEGNSYPFIVGTAAEGSNTESTYEESTFSEWERRVSASKMLEQAFEKMLIERYKIHICPSDFLLGFLRGFFGRAACKVKTFQVVLPKQPTGKTNFGLQSGKPSKEIEDNSGSGYRRILSKLAALKHSLVLFASKNFLRVFNSAQPIDFRIQPRDHALLVLPSTYLTMDTEEIEMHACKYVHTLLGCRVALEEFLGQFLDHEGRKILPEDEFREELWDYECFRRPRLNWTNRRSDFHQPPRIYATSHRTSEFIPEGHDKPVTLRTIRVFQAVKQSSSR